MLGYDLKIACAQFRFIVDGENNEKHALQIYQNTCVPGYSIYDMQSLVLGRRRRRWSIIKSTLCERLSFDRHIWSSGGECGSWQSPEKEDRALFPFSNFILNNTIGITAHALDQLLTSCLNPATTYKTLKHSCFNADPVQHQDNIGSTFLVRDLLIFARQNIVVGFLVIFLPCQRRDRF